MSIYSLSSWFKPGLGLAVTCAVLLLIASRPRSAGHGLPGLVAKSWLFDTAEAGPAGEISSLALSGDGEFLAAGARGGAVCVWEAVTRRLVARWQAHEAQVMALAFFHDARGVFTAGADGRVSRWAVGNGVEAAGGWRSEEIVTALAAAPDGRVLAAASGGRVGLFDACRGDLLHGGRLPGPPGPVVALAFSPDGRSLAAGGGGDNAIRVWDLGAESPALLRTLAAGAENWVRGLAYAADGATLVSIDTEGVVRTWDPDGVMEGNARAVGPLPLPASLGAGGRLVLTGAESRCAARLWEISGRWWR